VGSEVRSDLRQRLGASCAVAVTKNRNKAGLSRRLHAAATVLDQSQRADRQLDPDRRMRPGADRIAPCTTLGRPLVRGLAGGLRSTTGLDSGPIVPLA
jgi:hypothetical protein